MPCIWGIPSAHTQIEAGPDTRKDPSPRPQHSFTCGYHAVHKVLCRADPSQELAYPLPTTDQEVHQIRKLICEILATATEDGKLLFGTARPTTDQRSAPLRADTYTDTTHIPTQSLPMLVPPCCPPGDPHTPTNARSPGSRNTGLPHPPKQQHTPATDPPAGHPSPPPTLDNPHIPTEGSPTPHGTPTPPSDPHTPPAHTPKTQAHPLRPPNAARANCSPPWTPTHTASHIAGPRPSQAQKEKTTAPRLPPQRLRTRSARRAARSQPAPPNHQPPTYSLRTWPPSSLLWQQQKPPPTNPRPPASQRNPRPQKPPLPPRPQPHRCPPPHPPTPPSQPTSSTRPRQKPKLLPHARLPGTPRPPHRRPRHPGSTPGKPSTRHRHPHTSGPSSSSTSNWTLNQNPTPNPSRRPKERTTSNSTTTNTTPRSPQRHKRNDANPSDTALTQTLTQTGPPTHHNPLPPPTSGRRHHRGGHPTRPRPNPRQHHHLQAPVIRPPKTTTAAGQTDPGTWDPWTTITVKPGPRPAPAAHQTVRPEGLHTMPDPPTPTGGPEYPQGVLGPYPQHHPHHYQRQHHQRPHHQQPHHLPHHYHCPPPYPTGPQPPCTSSASVWDGSHRALHPHTPPTTRGHPPRTRHRIPPATTSTPKWPLGPNPTRDSYSTRTTSRCRHRTPTWRIN